MDINLIKNYLRSPYYRYFVCPLAEMKHRRLIKVIQRRGYAKVVFFATNIAMWKYQGIYDILKTDDRFKLYILICPLRTLSSEQQKDNIRMLRSYFDEKKIEFIDIAEWPEEIIKLRESIDPDILFYTQPYGSEFGNSLDSIYYEDKLLCYAPYGVRTISAEWSENTRFQNIAWKLFYETEVNYKYSIEHTYERGRNVTVVGDTSADDFLKDQHLDCWKQQPKSKIRIIWAPHFSLEQTQILNRGSFLWLSDAMLDIAKSYSDKIQIAFKPHPRLKSVLYNYPGWGKHRTDAYYRLWSEMPNTQFEDAEFVDLFMTSDAMIHDSGSFTAEYHFTRKPVLFTSQIIDEIRYPLNTFGKDAIDAHYHARNVEDVIGFINNVLIEGNDPMFQVRQDFFLKYLLPPNGKSVAENIYEDIVLSLWK